MRLRIDISPRGSVAAFALAMAILLPAPASAEQPIPACAVPNCWCKSGQQPTACAVPNCWCKTGGTAPAGDPYGFTSWLNATRARYGLAPVGHDSNLASWAAANNAQQQARGLGHFVMGPSSRQNSAIGSAASIGAQWMSSPAHRAALLDPNVRWIGLAGLGAYWTLNLR